MDGSESTPIAPTPEGTEPEAAPVAPSGNAGLAPVDDGQKERDRLAQMGRKVAAAERENQNLKGQLTHLQTQLTQLGRTVSERQKAEYDAYLASLPTDQRLVKEVADLKSQLSAVRTPPTPQMSNDEMIRLRSQEILQAVNEMYELDDSVQLSPEDFGAYDSSNPIWQGERAFLGAAKKMARDRLLKGKDEMAKPNTNDPKPAPTGPQDVTSLVQEQVKKQLQELGFGRSNSPRPASGSVPSTAPGTVDQLVHRYKPGGTSPKAIAEAARQAKEQALKNLNRGK